MRFIGALLVLLAIGLLGAEVFWWLTGSEGVEFELASVGQWWFWIDQDSLQLVQPAIERHVPFGFGEWLYPYVVQPVLLGPAVVEAFVLGLVLIILGKLF